MTYEYPCSVCKVEMKWGLPDERLGRTCPKCKKNRMDEMIAWGEEQGKDEERLHRQMDDWWNDLSKDNQQKAFFAVVKRLNEAECIEELSYRQTLGDKFGFEPEAYYMGLLCGFMNLHNSIASKEELSEMRMSRAERLRKSRDLTEKFTIKSTCTSCGYQSMDIYPSQKLLCPTSFCEGEML